MTLWCPPPCWGGILIAMERDMTNKALRKYFSGNGPSQRLTLSYFSPDIDAKWIFDDEGDVSLQIVYQRKSVGETYNPETGKGEVQPDENFWLYLTAQDAAQIGAILVAYAAAHGEKA